MLADELGLSLNNFMAGRRNDLGHRYVGPIEFE